VIGISADQHATGLGSALHPGGDVCGVAHCCVFRLDLITDSGKHREPGIDADAHLEVNPVVALDRFSVLSCRCLDIKTRTYGSFCVVFVCNRRTEKGDDCIAKQPRDRPTVFRYRSVEEGERTVHDLRNLFRIKLLSHYGRVDRICEKNGHKFALACHRTWSLEGRSAVQAESCALGIGGLAVRADHIGTSFRL
jgi:hypothetical protein